MKSNSFDIEINYFLCNLKILSADWKKFAKNLSKPTPNLHLLRSSCCCQIPVAPILLFKLERLYESYKTSRVGGLAPFQVLAPGRAAQKRKALIFMYQIRNSDPNQPEHENRKNVERANNYRACRSRIVLQIFKIETLKPIAFHNDNCNRIPFISK